MGATGIIESYIGLSNDSAEQNQEKFLSKAQDKCIEVRQSCNLCTHTQALADMHIPIDPNRLCGERQIEHANI